MTSDAPAESPESDPATLERLYRTDPAAFDAALAALRAATPDAPALAFWDARLDADRPGAEHVGAGPRRDGEHEAAPPADDGTWAADGINAPALVAFVAGLVAIAGTVLRLPWLFGWDDAGGDFLLRAAPFAVLGPLLALLAARYRSGARASLVVAGAFAGLLAVQAVRPSEADPFTLSVLHVPALLVLLGGVAMAGPRWREVAARTAFVQLLAETLVLAALFLLGGVVLVVLTGALFEAIGIEAWETLAEWLVPYGLAGVLPVGALMASLRPGAGRLAPLAARVFGPLALAVLTVYLPVLILSGGLADRDALLALNGALLAVVALVVGLRAERPDGPSHWTDVVAVGLVVLALASDAAALVSVAARLAEGGLTPNRVALVGMNALVAVHLAGLARPLMRGADRGASDAWTARMLPAYAAWCAAVVLVFPLLFRG